MEIDQNKIKNIILNNLRVCYLDDGLLASPINFHNFWGRDTFWSILGLIHGNQQELEMSKRSIRLFAKYQRKDGKIPRKIIYDFDFLKRLGFSVQRPSLLPLYNSPIKLFYSLDENLLFVIAFYKYVEQTNNLDFARKNYDRASLALSFFYDRKLVRNELLYEFGLGNWMDTILKRGHVLYTNCLWAFALENFWKLSNFIQQDRYKSFPDHNYVKKRINDLFWNDFDNYYVDAISPAFKQKEFFDTAGNALAVYFDIADQDRSRIICEKINSLKSSFGLHPVNYPQYPFRKVNPLTYLLGIPKYHNGISWSWVEIIIALSFLKTGMHKEAEELYATLCGLIEQNDGIHETLRLNGTPYDHKYWKSAIPFAWSAGLFLLLAKEFS